MKALTDAERLEIAVALLSEGNLENYAAICKLVEGGVPVLDAINEIGK